MVSQRKIRRPTGDSLSEIVRLLRKKENLRLRFKDLLKLTGLSKPVLSYHLKKLKKEGTVISIKDGREKYYVLTKNMYKIPERQIDILASDYSLFSNNELAFSDFTDKQEFYARIGEKFNAIMIFSVLKSIEKGQDITNAIDLKEFLFMLSNWIVISIHEDKPSEKLNELVLSNDFKKIKSILQKSLKNGLKTNLKPYYDTLQTMYPMEFEIMKYSSEKPQLNWQKHYAEIKNK